ncbi:MAG: MFS transporter [Bacillota bacterium]
MSSISQANIKFTMTRRQKLLMPIVMIGAFFEGYDFMVINMSLPYIAHDFVLDDQVTGMMLSIIAIGTLMAFFMVRLGDKYGRKPVFLVSVAAFSLLSLATAFTPNMQLFVICQFLARIFLVATWAVGIIIMAEEFPVELRGRAIGLFQGAAAIGAIFPSLLLPVAAMTPLGWRTLFIIGALPLVIVLIMGKNFHETERFKKAKESSEAKPSFFAVFKHPYRKHMIAVSALWFFIYMGYTTAMTFFSYRVVNELGWTESQVGLTMALAFTIGLSGYVVAGKLLDAMGRKKTAMLFFLCGVSAVVLTFQLTTYIPIMLAQIVGVFFVGSFTVICASFTNELFPTAIRANATAWGNNIFGRIGQIMAPALVGFLAVHMGGVGNAVSLVALGPLAGIFIVAVFMPETRNREMKDHMDVQGEVQQDALQV